MAIELKEVIHLYVGCDVIIDGKERGRLMGGDFIPNSCNQIYYDISLEGEDPDVYIPYNDDRDSELRVKPILRPLSSMSEDEKLEYNKRKQRKGYMAQIHADNTLWLLNKGFDLFHLIPAGLAIDSTTLNPQH